MAAFVALILAAASAFSGAVSAPKANKKRAKPRASAKGNVTGGPCAVDGDCWVACAPSDPKTASCFSKKEASPKCLESGTAQWGPGGLPCACLPDVKRCGFAHP